MNKYTISLLLSFIWLTVCGVTCHPYGDDACGGACTEVHIDDETCVNHFRYKINARGDVIAVGSEIVYRDSSIISYIQSAVKTSDWKAREDTSGYIVIRRFIEDTALYTNSSITIYETDESEIKTLFWGPYKEIDIFDTLTFKLFFFCNGKWVESRDYKFLNREDVFTHIDFKEQEEGELMFDVSADSVCQGLSNYRISQYTDTECIDELNGK